MYLHIVLPEASWYHAPALALHPEGYSPGVRVTARDGKIRSCRRLRPCAAPPRRPDAERGAGARYVRRLLLPALPMAAPPLGATHSGFGARLEPIRGVMLRLTQLFNLSGHPAVAIPAGMGSDGLPRGLQLVGRRSTRGGPVRRCHSRVVRRRMSEAVRFRVARDRPAEVPDGCPVPAPRSGSPGGIGGFTGGGCLMTSGG